MTIKIAVLIACHNRAALTEILLNSLIAASTPDISIQIYGVDDGSSDDTTKVINNFGGRCISGPGNWFWAKSMSVAERFPNSDVDGFLWLNDDVCLARDSMEKLLIGIRDYPSCVLVGQVRHPSTHQITYGGLLRRGIHPHRFSLVRFSEVEDLCVDTFCGNFVFIPKEISDSVGKIDWRFEHGFADYDFGLRVSKMGYPIRVLRGVIGECAPNFELSNLHLSYLKRVKFVFSRKYIPLKSQFIYTKRHAGILWPIFLLFPYLKVIFGASIKKSGLK